MDDLDRRILDRLRVDASATNAAIGRQVGLTEAAVRRRISRLRKDGTILRYTVVTVPLGPEGLVLVKCRPGRTAEVLKRLQERASEVFETSGEFDFGAFVESGSMEAFNQELDRLRAIDGVVSTATLVRLTRSVRPTAPTPGAAAEPAGRSARTAAAGGSRR